MPSANDMVCSSSRKKIPITKGLCIIRMRTVCTHVGHPVVFAQETTNLIKISIGAAKKINNIMLALKRNY